MPNEPGHSPEIVSRLAKDRGHNDYSNTPVPHPTRHSGIMEVEDKNVTRVKDKTPAPIQITAEQLLQEATARLALPLVPPRRHVNGPRSCMIAGMWESTGSSKGRDSRTI